jgi:hypothetical protein
MTIAIGAVLVALALPRAIAYIIAAPDDEIVVALSSRTPPQPAVLQSAVASRREALRWHESGRLRADLAALELRLAHGAGYASLEGRARLERVTGEARAALAAAPVQSYVWTGLVQATLAEKRDARALAPLYRMAVRSAPYHPPLVLQRIELGLAAARQGPLDAALREDLDGQIRIAAEAAPKELARIARRRLALGEVRAALAVSPDLRARFDTAYLSSVR